MLAVGELSVNFIGDHHDVGSPQNFGDGLQVLSGHNAAGGIAREGKDQNFCLRRNGAFQLPGGEAELILGLELQIYGGASGHRGQRTVAHEGGDGDDHLVAGIEHAAQRQINSLAAADRNNNLMGKIVVQVEAAGQIGGDLPAQLSHAGVAGVLGKALFQ